MFSKVFSIAALFCISMAIISASCPDVKSLIAKHEGDEQCVYTDTTGHKTIGIGFNLERPDAPQKIASVGADYDAVYSGQQCLNEKQINSLFQDDVKSATRGAQGCVSSYKSQCECVQTVLIDMDFNLGDAGLCSFGTFIDLINAGQYQEAANDLKGTLWCSQVGNRCTDDTNIISQGCGGRPSTDDDTPIPSHDDDSGHCPSECATCVENAGGKACVDRCNGCSTACIDCINGGGGTACASRCH